MNDIPLFPELQAVSSAAGLHKSPLYKVYHVPSHMLFIMERYELAREADDAFVFMGDASTAYLRLSTPSLCEEGIVKGIVLVVHNVQDDNDMIYTPRHKIGGA